MGPRTEFTPRSVAVIIAVFISSLGSGLFVANAAIAIFIGKISQDLGWSRAQIGGAASLLFVGMALGAPFFGKLVDRFGPRIVMLPLTALSGIVMASLSILSHSLALFYAGHLLLGLSTPSAVAASKLISTWFFRHRGISRTTLGLGVFCAQVAIPPVTHYLMTHFGWSHAYLVFGAAELLISCPILFLFFRERKADAVDADPAESNEIEPD